MGRHSHVLDAPEIEVRTVAGITLVLDENMIRAITFRFRRKVMRRDEREDVDRGYADP